MISSMTKGSKEHWSQSAASLSSNYRLTSALSRLEAIIRDSIASGDHERIAKIVDQLCHDYAYAVHQPNARNGGLIGLAAASIALGSVSIGRCSLQSEKV